jgi:hypothetical protein
MALLAILSIATGCASEVQPHPVAAPPDLPHQNLLASSMREQPVPGWTTTVAELGLPLGTVVRPVDHIGDLGIYLGITDEGWWLFGLNVTSGKRSFGPVRLGAAGNATNFSCFVNGPPLVLCVRQAADPGAPSAAWVIDTDSGRMVFDGPTDLQVAQDEGRPRLEQIGDYTIATMTGKGVLRCRSPGRADLVRSRRRELADTIHR